MKFEDFLKSCIPYNGAIPFVAMAIPNGEPGKMVVTFAISLHLNTEDEEGYLGLGESDENMPEGINTNLAFVRALKSAAEQAERDIYSVLAGNGSIKNRVAEATIAALETMSSENIRTVLGEPQGPVH